MSRRKKFFLRIEIDIHSVDCREVRLCQSGNVAVRVHTLSSVAVTKPRYPPFPIHIHETLLFEKVLDSVSSLTEIQDHLDRESAKVEFVYHPGHGGEEWIIADFRTKLSNLIFPTFLNGDFIDGGRVKFLIDAADNFAGGAHPRVEVSTKIGLEEKSASTDCRWCTPERCGRTRNKRTNGSDVRWPHGNIACSDCCICNRYSGYFGSKSCIGSRPRSCSFVKHWFASGEMDKPIPYRQLFYENLEFFYRQLQKRKALNRC